VGICDGNEKARAFLKQGDVLTDDFFDLKMAEQKRLDITPHPLEYFNDYSA